MHVAAVQAHSSTLQLLLDTCLPCTLLDFPTVALSSTGEMYTVEVSIGDFLRYTFWMEKYLFNHVLFVNGFPSLLLHLTDVICMLLSRT